jgi:hypothetical protein
LLLESKHCTKPFTIFSNDKQELEIKSSGVNEEEVKPNCSTKGSTFKGSVQHNHYRPSFTTTTQQQQQQQQQHNDAPNSIVSDILFAAATTGNSLRLLL